VTPPEDHPLRRRSTESFLIHPTPNLDRVTYRAGHPSMT
jgi:hypothetical protein